MKQTLCLILLLLACVTPTLAQKRNSDRCQVQVANLKTKNSVQLGSFSTVLGEEELTTKAFRLPHSRYFIVASVFYTDESMASSQSSDSVMLELTLSRDKQRDVLRSLSWAEAELPIINFEVARVAMLIKVNGQTQLVLMECKADVRL